MTALVSHKIVERSRSKHNALMQHQNRGRQRANERHVVLNDDQRVLRRQTVNKRDRAALVVLAHSGSRFVEQNDGGVLGQNQRHLEPLLLSVGERAGQIIDAVPESHPCERFIELDTVVEASTARVTFSRTVRS